MLIVLIAIVQIIVQNILTWYFSQPFFSGIFKFFNGKFSSTNSFYLTLEHFSVAKYLAVAHREIASGA